MRSIGLLALLLVAPAAIGKSPEPSQFLDRSYVEVPKSAGPFTLLNKRYEPNSFYQGVATEWTSTDSTPSMRIDVFVYPQGRADEATAVAGAMDEVEAAVAEAAKRGLYSNVKLGTRAPFLVVRAHASVMDTEKKPKPAFDPTPKPETRWEVDGDPKDPMLKAFAESQPSPNNHGQRLSFQFDRDGGTWRSTAIVVYRHLFRFKLRISVPVEEMSQEAFDRLADSAAREIVPRINVMNFGRCGNIEIALPAEGTAKGAADQQSGEQLIRGLARIQNENCAMAPGKKDDVPVGFEREVIEYPPNTWKAGD